MTDTIRVRSQKTKFVQLEHDLHSYLPKIGSHGYVLYSILARYADYDTGKCYPKISNIAKMMGLSRSTVHAALDGLIAVGLVRSDSGAAMGKYNDYTLLPLTSKVLGGVDLSTGGVSGPTGGVDRSTPIKEEREPLNENQLPFTLKPPSSAGTNGSKSSKAKPEVDPRHAKFRKTLEIVWNHYNPEQLYNWNVVEASRLKTFLKAWPNLTIQEFREWLDNYLVSDGIIESSTPKEILSKIHRYKNGPLNQYGKPQELEPERKGFFY